MVHGERREYRQDENDEQYSRKRVEDRDAGSSRTGGQTAGYKAAFEGDTFTHTHTHRKPTQARGRILMYLRQAERGPHTRGGDRLLPSSWRVCAPSSGGGRGEVRDSHSLAEEDAPLLSRARREHTSRLVL